MAWYVFALVDEPLTGRPAGGLSGRLASRRVPGGYAIVERRADVPPVEFGTLKKHDAVIARVSAVVPAILPVRFGTLLESEEIDAALADREEEMADAFDVVRGRVQFTWRAERGARGAQGLSAVARSAKADARGLSAVARSAKADATGAGAAYLRGVAAKAAPPAVFRPLRDTLRPLVAMERFQPATASLPDSLYHLVERASVERYGLLAHQLAEAATALRLSGPFAPFAFTPDLL